MLTKWEIFVCMCDCFLVTKIKKRQVISVPLANLFMWLIFSIVDKLSTILPSMSHHLYLYMCVSYALIHQLYICISRQHSEICRVKNKARNNEKVTTSTTLHAFVGSLCWSCSSRISHHTTPWFFRKIPLQPLLRVCNTLYFNFMNHKSNIF